jgi:hypothetical protein
MTRDSEAMDSKRIFKQMQSMIVKQSPATQVILDNAEEITNTFVEGLKKCDSEMSFMACFIPSFPEDSEGLRMASEIDCYFTAICNNLKYDFSEIVEKYDFDRTTETVENGTELWIHARQK